MGDDDAARPLEAELMALLDGIIVQAEQAQSFIQDDSRISRSDAHEIIDRLMKIRSLTIDIERAIRRSVKL